MSDAFQVKVGGDFQELLKGFQQLEQRAKTAGDNVGKGLADGIQGFSSKSLAALQQELNRLQQRQFKVAVDSSAFEKAGVKIKEVQGLIAAVQREQLRLTVNDRSVTAIQSKLADLQSRQLKVDVDSADFTDLQRQINAIEGELDGISRRKVIVDADANSVLAVTAKLQSELERLSQKQLKVDVDGAEFAQLGREINRVEGELNALQQRRLSINTDPGSIIAMRSRLGELQAELEKVRVGSQRFIELKDAIRQAEDELSRAGESTDQFRLLDGVIQGVAFSLSNAVVGAAGQALGAIRNVVGEFARLDTEIRKAAAAGGEAGGYDKLSRVIDQVGIEAAGTQLQVAELATSLVRAGFTVQQVEEALPGVVRGAEATGTGFEQMGNIVGSTLRGMGLDVKETSRVVDVLVNTANASNASIESLGYTMQYAAPIAKALNVSLEDVAAASGLMANAGIDASVAGTGLRTGLERLQKAAAGASGESLGLSSTSKQLGRAMKALGAEVTKANGELLPLDQVLVKLKSSFDRLSTAEKVEMASALFGEEAGSKFLSILNQSTTDIQKMFDVIRASAGATDTARDAMQGFELKMQQLDGTLGSIGNVFGKVTATAMIPFLDLANSIVGAISELPGPVKEVGAGLVVLTGSLAAATTGLVVFNAAMATTQVQSAIAAIGAFATAIKVNLAGAATVGIVAMNALGKAMIAASVTQFSLKAAIVAGASGIKAALTSAATAGIAAIKALYAAIASGQILANLKAMAVAAKALLVTFGPIAAAAAAVTGAVAAWSYTLSGASKVSEGFEESQKSATDAVNKLNAELGKIEAPAKRAEGGLKGVLDQIGMLFNYVKESNALLRLSQEFEKLQSTFTEAQIGALEFFNEIKKGGAITDEQKAKAEQYIIALEAVGEAAKNEASRYKLLAAEAARASNPALAADYLKRAGAMESEGRASDGLVAAYRRLTGISKEQTDATKANTAATADAAKAAELAKAAVERRAQAEAELNQIIAAAPVRQLDAQLAVGQQLVGLAQSLAALEQSRSDVIRSGLEFELQSAQERGASEAEVGAIKRQIQEQDRQATEARYAALQQEQQLQVAMLALAQQKARAEANLDVLNAKNGLLEAEKKQKELGTKATTEERAAAAAVVKLQEAIVGQAGERVKLLEQTQPLEAAILANQQQIARNGEQATAAQKGFKIEADGSVTAAAALARELGTVRQRIKEASRDQASLRSTQGVDLIGQQINASKALAAQEQSRFSVVRAQLEYELQKAQERGAKEQELGRIKERIQQVDAAAIQANYNALLQQQQLEADMLILQQQKQAQEAILNVKKEQVSLLETEQNLLSAVASGDPAAVQLAREQVNLQRMKLGMSVEQLSTLSAMQRLEGEALQSQQNAALNAERARAAQQGIQLASRQSAVDLRNVATNADTYRAALTAAATEFQKINQSRVGDAIQEAGKGAENTGSGMEKAAAAADLIDGLNLPAQFESVAKSTYTAAAAAQQFYRWLEQASRLPGARWTGGPVEAGESYKVNELGQEALLSGGRLSLINAAPNSIWRAPTNGTVIPAGITSRLQEQGALPGAGEQSLPAPAAGGLGNAQLAVEIGKLRQEVGELARKQWNVNVAMKTGPTGSQVLRQMLR